ncbi:MAG: fumarate hydratase, partial [Lachnospiraceae bacterium]|nr:fumarate hydratase [Lachnospiraceae bacterium]
MRTIDVNVIADAIAEMCVQANLSLTPDMLAALEGAAKSETSELGMNIMGQLQENLKIAGGEKIPICQDTGMAIVFVKA